LIISLLYLYAVKKNIIVRRKINETYREILDTDYTALVRFPIWQDFNFLLSVQTGSRAHPATYPMGTGDSFHGGRAARA
jgi:hypothetical protein